MTIHTPCRSIAFYGILKKHFVILMVAITSILFFIFIALGYRRLVSFSYLLIFLEALYSRLCFRAVFQPLFGLFSVCNSGRQQNM